MDGNPGDGAQGELPYRHERLIRQSGVTFHEAQVALAKIYVGSDDVRGDVDEVVNIEQAHDQRTGVDEIGKKDSVEKAVPLPKTVDEVRKLMIGAH
jgi:phospholipase D1/2